MRAEIRHFHSRTATLESFCRDDPEDVGVLVQIVAGPVDGPGEESFDVMVLTPRRLTKWIEERGPLVGRHHLFVDRFDWPTTKDFLKAAVEREVGIVGRTR